MCGVGESLILFLEHSIYAVLYLIQEIVCQKTRTSNPSGV